MTWEANGGVFAEDLEFDESDEATRGRGWQPRGTPRTSGGKGLYSPRTTQYVTQTQLASALAKVGEEIKTNSSAIATVNTRLNTLGSDQTRLATTVKKENEAVRRDLSQLQQLSMILPMIQNRSVALSAQVANLPANTRVLTEPADNLSLLLPMMLMGGMGTGSSSGSGMLGGDSGMSMIALMLLLRR